MSTPTASTIRNANKIADWLIDYFDDYTVWDLALSVRDNWTEQCWQETIRRAGARRSFDLRSATANVLAERAAVRP